MLFLMGVGTVVYLVAMFSLLDIIGGSMIGVKIGVVVIPIWINILLLGIKLHNKRREEMDRIHMSTFLNKYENGIF